MNSVERLAPWPDTTSMPTGGIDGVPLLDRAVARWEVSGSSMARLGFAFLILAPLLPVIWALILIGHSKSSGVLALALLTGWLIVAGLEGGRAFWISRHPLASQRWLRAVRAAVGDDVAQRAVGWLVLRYGDQPDYRVRRSDMTLAVQIGRSEQREAACWAEGVRLRGAADTDPTAAAERRSDRRAQAAA